MYQHFGDIAAAICWYCSATILFFVAAATLLVSPP
jgi:uncharacterized membrane protein YtjA (UPF0391 family)